MPIDPTIPPSTDPAQRAADRLAALERRLAALETGSGLLAAPPVAALPAPGRKGRLVTLDDGTGSVYVDTVDAWVRLGP